MDIETEKAEQQLTGFIHCYDGGDLESLVNSMGLTREEWETIKRQGVLPIPDEIFEEIEMYFKKGAKP